MMPYWFSTSSVTKIIMIGRICCPPILPCLPPYRTAEKISDAVLLLFSSSCWPTSPDVKLESSKSSPVSFLGLDEINVFWGCHLSFILVIGCCFSTLWPRAGFLTSSACFVRIQPIKQYIVSWCKKFSPWSQGRKTPSGREKRTTYFPYAYTCCTSFFIDQSGKASSNNARGQLNRETYYISSLPPFAPEILVSRDGFDCPIPRQPQRESGAHSHDSSSFPRRRPLILYRQPP